MGDSENRKKRKSDEERGGFNIDLLLPFQIAQLNAKLATQARIIIARHGTLSLPEWRIIRVVGMGVASSSTAVRKTSGIDKGQFSKTVNRLVKEGYVELLPFNGDKRQFEIQLTPKGKKAHDRLAPQLDARQRHLLAALGPAERKTIFSAIRALATAAETTEFDK
jgi:DNA-binding MarR family transcriptional regulator